MKEDYLNSNTEQVVPISALEHFSYCPRQCALIHIEQTFDENVFTVRGRLVHERTDSGTPTTSKGVRQLRSLPLFSDEYGLVGKADVVEVSPHGPVPVEHKVGRVASDHAAIQLCAQAFCLEEMFGVPVFEGVIFSHATKRRARIDCDEGLRRRTRETILAVRELLVRQSLPSPVNDSRCPDCSLINACLPAIVAETHRIRGYQGALFLPADPDSIEGWFDV